MEVRSRWTRPKPNIGKVSGRKEASAQGEFNKSGSDSAGEQVYVNLDLYVLPEELKTFNYYSPKIIL